MPLLSLHSKKGKLNTEAGAHNLLQHSNDGTVKMKLFGAFDQIIWTFHFVLFLISLNLSTFAKFFWLFSLKYNFPVVKCRKGYSSENFYRHIPWVAIIDQDTENFHYPRSFPGAPVNTHFPFWLLSAQITFVCSWTSYK